MKKTFQRGIIVGKFCPLHRGHEYAIRTMLDACEEGFILSYTNPEFPGFDPEKRHRWLIQLFPQARVLVLGAADAPPNDADDLTQRKFVARICRERLHTTVDAVFSSEDYGEGFAQELAKQFSQAVQHISVDPLRLRHPVSGTQLRADVLAHRDQLSPIVYADFVQRICLLGGESTGKSTLAKALASHFHTNHVAEYGRELWEVQNGHLDFADMLLIAKTQVAREQTAAQGSNRFLFCDTSPLTTLLYSQHLFGRVAPELETLSRRDYSLHILCAPDFPFHQDGTRQNAAFRGAQNVWYRAALKRLAVPWIEVCGSERERIRQVENCIA